ncbi:S8 family serine peptidase [Candidatus Bathyarchaeota archaeon]|nr:S8 family serine peptidase [Candidatus Bathyarchaeota archaeon]
MKHVSRKFAVIPFIGLLMVMQYIPMITASSNQDTYPTPLNEPFIDPNLESRLQGDDPSSIITVWFLFSTEITRAAWLEGHSSLHYRRVDVNTGIYLRDTIKRIQELLTDDSACLIESAWLERQINTRIPSAHAPGDFISTSTSPSNITHQAFNISNFREETGLDGTGVVIGLLSTGVGLHDDLKYVYNETGNATGMKVIANVSFVDWDPLYIDVQGEGTYLAGILAGTGNASNGEFTGVAPGAQIINAKCVDFIGITLWYWAVSALEFSFSHGADIIVAGWNIIGYPGDPLTVAIEEITQRGVLVVSAAGDLGPSYMTINTPGMASSAITAGGLNTTDPVAISPANFSSRGVSLEFKSKPDILAPGVNITSCMAELDLSEIESYADLPINISTTYGDPLPSNPQYTSVSSTAASAAFTAGACALLLQEYKFVKPEIIKDAIIRTSIDLGEDANVQGAGALNLSLAWEYLSEHESPMPSFRSFTPAQLYAGFLPNYELTPTTNRTSLFFVSNYGTVNFYTNLIQNITDVQERNVTHLLQGMFGLHVNGSFSYFMMDNVLREMHVTHVGNYSRAFSILEHSNDLLVIITAEGWRASMDTFRLRFDIINIGDEPVENISMHSWWKADLDILEDLEQGANDDTGGYLPANDILYVNDTTKGPANESFFMMKASQQSDAHAIGGLADTMDWVMNDSLSFSGSPLNDSIDNVTVAAKYRFPSMLEPGEMRSINFSMGCGVNFTSLREEVNFTISGYEQPSIRDIVVVKSELDRMYEVEEVIETSCMVINTGNNPVNDTQLVYATTRTLENSTETTTQTWDLGQVVPLEPMLYNTTWAPTYEGVYACSWISADSDTIQDLIFNLEDITDIDFDDFEFPGFDIGEINWTEFLSINGSLGDLLLGLDSEDNPLDNLLLRDIFIYLPERMYIHSNLLEKDIGKSTPRPYAGVTPADPITASMKPEFIGDFAIMNLSLYSSVPLTGFEYESSGNGSVMVLEDVNDLASMLMGDISGTENHIMGVMGDSVMNASENEPVNVSFWAMDDREANITAWEILLDGQVISSGKPNKSMVVFSYLNSTGLPAGVYNITARAWDNSSNPNEMNVTLNVGIPDDHAPWMGTIGVPPSDLNDSSPVTIDFYIHDGGTGKITSWELLLDGSQVEVATPNATGAIVRFENTTGLPAGIHNITLIAFDNGSHQESFELMIEVEPEIDTTPRVTGDAIFIFIDATLLKFPMAANYTTTITFTSDQGHVDIITLEYTIELPRAKILFDTQHNDMLNILTGDMRDMIMGSYYQMYELATRQGYDIDEYIVFSNYENMTMEGISLFELYDAIIIADPEFSFSESELALLTNYTASGGNLIILADMDGGTGSFGSPDLLTGGLSMDSLGGFDDIDIDLDFEFDFDFEGIRDLLSGAGNLPDGCNITGLNELVSLYGFSFDQSFSNDTTITDFNTTHSITQNFSGSSIHMSTYTSFNITGNHSMNHPLAHDDAGNLVAAIHENPTSGGKVFLLSDSNLLDAYHIALQNNSDIFSSTLQYMLSNEINVDAYLSRPEIHLGENLFIDALIEVDQPGIDPGNLLGIVAFVHQESGEMILSQFLPVDGYHYSTFLVSDGMDLMGYYFPPLNFTGKYYALMIFNNPNITGVYAQLEFTVLDRLNDTGNEFTPPDNNVLFQGLIIFTSTMAIIILIYFNARRKQEESMQVPELDEKMVRNIDNVLMELQSKITVLSEEIMYKKSDDYKIRLQNLEERIKSFMKTVKKMRSYKKEMSKF